MNMSLRRQSTVVDYILGNRFPKSTLYKTFAHSLSTNSSFVYSTVIPQTRTPDDLRVAFVRVCFSKCRPFP